jgi:hypothetical protein
MQDISLADINQQSKELLQFLLILEEQILVRLYKNLYC